MRVIELVLAFVLAVAFNLAWRKVELMIYGIHQESMIDAVICGLLGALVARLIGRIMD